MFWNSGLFSIARIMALFWLISAPLSSVIDRLRRPRRFTSSPARRRT
jgi:hypothetical protein